MLPAASVPSRYSRLSVVAHTDTFETEEALTSSEELWQVHAARICTLYTRAQTAAETTQNGPNPPAVAGIRRNTLFSCIRRVLRRSRKF